MSTLPNVSESFGNSFKEPRSRSIVHKNNWAVETKSRNLIPWNTSCCISGFLNYTIIHQLINQLLIGSFRSHCTFVFVMFPLDRLSNRGWSRTSLGKARLDMSKCGYPGIKKKLHSNRAIWYMMLPIKYHCSFYVPVMELWLMTSLDISLPGYAIDFYRSIIWTCLRQAKSLILVPLLFTEKRKNKQSSVPKPKVLPFSLIGMKCLESV